MTNEHVWFYSSNFMEGVRSLRVARLHLAAGVVDAYELKWAVLATVSSVQGFIASAFTTSEIATWDADWMKQFRQWRTNQSAADFPDVAGVFLPSFLGLVGKVEEHRDYVPAPEVTQKLKALNKYRDMFMHWGRVSRAIRANDLRESCGAGMDVISFLVATPQVRDQFVNEGARHGFVHELSVAVELAKARTDQEFIERSDDGRTRYFGMAAEVHPLD